jgi:bacillithiol biosynthesis cysteine-adding enzyme BshC
MIHLPEIHPRGLAPPGTLTGDLLAGTSKVELPLIERGSAVESGPVGRIGRLEASAFGCSTPTAEAKLESILAGSGQLVTTGQQPLLFLGPLFVLYKALTAIEMARRIEAATGTPTLAAFWIASDDHDWEEVGSTSILDAAGNLRRLRLNPPEGRAARAVGSTRLDTSSTPLLDELVQLFPESEFASAYIECLRGAYAPGHRVADAFANSLAHALASFDFAWLDSAHADVKRASVPLFRHIIDGGAAAEEALSEGARRLGDAGYEPPIPLLTDAYPLLLDTGERRERLYRTGEGARLGRAGERVTAPELAAWLENEPERFSPNVASRPMLESWLLPVAATVLGPGEIAYWSQLPPLFGRYEVPVPRIQPRTAWTLVEAKIARVLDRLDVSAEDLADGGDSLIGRITRDSRPPAIDAALSELREAVAPGLDGLDVAIGEELPGLRSAAGKARKQVLDALGALGSRIDAGVREREESSVLAVRRGAAHLFPGGHPQERVVSPYYYLARYGPELVTRLATLTREALGDSDAGGPE